MQHLRLILSCLIFFPLVGCVFGGCAWSDYQESHSASVQPDHIDLADLEAGTKKIGNNHVVIGPHTACYPSTIYTYLVDKDHPKAVDNNTKISGSFYPILSSANPATKRFEELRLAHQGEEIPPEAFAAVPTQFVMVVKTNRFKKVGEVPWHAIQTDAQVQGLVLNHSKLHSDESALLRESFPNVNTERVIILEEGRMPSSSLWCYTRIALGVVIGLTGIALAIGILVVSIYRSGRAPQRSRRWD